MTAKKFNCSECGVECDYGADTLNFEQKKCEDHVLIEAVPPMDYKGSLANWCEELMSRGLWDGENPDFHGDVVITGKDWWDILESCEATA